MAVEDTWWRHDQAGTLRKTARYGKGLRWRVRWRDLDGRQRAKSFRTKDAAVAFDRDEVARLAATPPGGGATCGDYLARWWITKQRLGPATVRDYDQVWHSHVDPRWGKVPVTDVTGPDVGEWAAGLPVRVMRARRAVLVLRQALDIAVADGTLAKNPAAGVRVAGSRRAGRSVVRVLTSKQVRAVLDAAGPHRGLVHWAVTAGPRWGELAGFDVGDVDLVRRRVHVARTASTIGSDVVLQDMAKGGRDRFVPLTPGVVVDLEPLVEGRGPGEPLFVTGRGNRWRYSSWKRVWGGIRDAAGVSWARTHDLRHTAASLAIASGADVKQVQAMLGHTSATMTLDLYGHLWADHYGALGDRIGALLDEE